jgi:ubiquinone/menaquinone biosynthesis C-methylase UbiE
MSSVSEPTTAQRTARDVWRSGDYPTVVDRLITGFGPTLVEAAGIGPGQRVLDVACGAGNVAIPAAAAGADVTGLDITPELLERGAAEAAAAGVEVAWVEGDAQAMPFADASFDVVVSAVGVMFAPDHDAAAAELLRVCRPGGTIALISWTPDGTIGRLFGVIGPFAAPPAPGARPGSLWGTASHVRDLLGDGVEDLESTRDEITFDVPTPDAFVDLMRDCYGPVLKVYGRVGDDAARTAELDAALRAFARESASPSGELASAYQLTVCRRR